MIISEKATKLFSDFSKQTLSVCDLGMFIEQNDLNSETFRFCSKRLRPYFKDKEDFKNWLQLNEKTSLNTDCYKEFVDFFKKSEEINTVSFQFEHLHPHRFNTNF